VAFQPNERSPSDMGIIATLLNRHARILL